MWPFFLCACTIFSLFILLSPPLFKWLWGKRYSTHCFFLYETIFRSNIKHIRYERVTPPTTYETERDAGAVGKSLGNQAILLSTSCFIRISCARGMFIVWHRLSNSFEGGTQHIPKVSTHIGYLKEEPHSLYIIVCIRTLKIFSIIFFWECAVLYSEY